MTKSQNKYEKLFDSFLDLTEFSLIKYKDGFGLEDHQGANLGDIEFSYDDIPNTLEGRLNHKEELKEYQYEIDLIDMICNHYNEINLENCTYEIINA